MYVTYKSINRLNMPEGNLSCVVVKIAPVFLICMQVWLNSKYSATEIGQNKEHLVVAWVSIGPGREKTCLWGF